MSTTPLLTRAGAYEATQHVDRLANLIEIEAAVLGLDESLVKKAIEVLDTVSDAVEKKASENFPLTAGELPPALQKINDEKAEKAEKKDEESKKEAAAKPAEGSKVLVEIFGKEKEGTVKNHHAAGDMADVDFGHGDIYGIAFDRMTPVESGKKAADFDPATIAEQTPGPLEAEPDEPYMDGHFTTVELYEVSEEFGGKLAAATDKTAASKLDSVTVQGYDGFTAQIRVLDELSTQAASLEAQIDAAIGPLLTQKAGLDKDIAKVHQTIKDEYKQNLDAVGNVTIERKTALVAARAKLQVVAVKRTLNDVQAELLAAIIEKYGKEVADFIKVTQGALQDTDKQMRVAFKGFELEQKAMQTHTASAKTAGLADLLATFQGWLDKGWKKMVQVAKTVGAIVSRSGSSCAKAHDSFMGSLDDIASGKTAAVAPTSHGFNLFKN